MLHLMKAYDTLRHNGVAIGKRDYSGNPCGKQRNAISATSTGEWQ